MEHEGQAWRMIILKKSFRNGYATVSRRTSGALIGFIGQLHILPDPALEDFMNSVGEKPITNRSTCLTSELISNVLLLYK